MRLIGFFHVETSQLSRIYVESGGVVDILPLSLLKELSYALLTRGRSVFLLILILFKAAKSQDRSALHLV